LTLISGKLIVKALLCLGLSKSWVRYYLTTGVHAWPSTTCIVTIFSDRQKEFKLLPEGTMEGDKICCTFDLSDVDSISFSVNTGDANVMGDVVVFNTGEYNNLGDKAHTIQ
jgi:hypothetical protein